MKLPSISWLLIICFLMLASCRLQPDKVNWESRMLTPLLKSDLTLMDAIKDTSFIRVETDQTITLVYSDTLIDFQLGDYVEVPDTSYSATVTLDSIRLSSGTFTDRRTLNELAAEMPPPTGPAISIACLLGSVPADIGPLILPSGTPTSIDASSYFEYATLQTGEMVITVTNTMPTDLYDVHFLLQNSSDMSMVADITIPLVPSGGATIHIEDLSGQYIEALMTGTLVSATTGVIPATTPLDCEAMYVEVEVKLQNLTASSARAIFPEQTVVDDQNNIKYNFGDGIALTRLGVRSGHILVNAASTVANPMEFSYVLPTAVKEGKTARVDASLPGSGSIDTLFDLSGYSIDLTLYGDSVNLFPQHLIGKLKYTGIPVDMDLSDVIEITYGLIDIKPSYVEGYIGQQAFHFEESAMLDFFASIQAGTLDLENPASTLRFESSIGADGELQMNELKGTNSRTGSTVVLDAAEFSKGFTVAGPRLPNVGQTVATRINLNRSNSNIADFLGILPDQVDANIDVVANAGVPSSYLGNFATDRSRITAFLDIEVPLHGVANALTLVQELDLNLSEAALPQGATEGNLNLVLSNGFPFEAQLQVIFKNAAGVVVDSLFVDGPQLIPAGTTDAYGATISTGEEVLTAWFDPARMDRLKVATTAQVLVVLDTRPTGAPVKVRADQGIRLHLTGDFNMGVGK